jgi:hypothetical protein
MGFHTSDEIPTHVMAVATAEKIEIKANGYESDSVK